MADGFEIPAEMIRALEHRLEMYGSAAEDAYGIAKDVVYTEAMKRAHASRRWVKVADFLDTWDENDRYWIGVRDDSMVSEAFAVEYGTEDYPPEPLLRTLDSAARIAGNRADAQLISKIGMVEQI